MRAAHDGRPPARACAPPRRWRRPTAVSSCSGAASVTSPSAAFACRLPAFSRLPDASARSANAVRTLRVPDVGIQIIEGRTEGDQHDHNISGNRHAIRRAGRRPAQRPDHAWRSRVRRGARRLQRHDRQARGCHRALPRRRRRRRLCAGRPRARRRDRRQGRRPQRRRPRRMGRCPGHRPITAAAAPRSAPTITPSAPTPDAPGETSITPPWRSAWPLPPASAPPPA
jgi:hypothetical protein